MNIRREPSGPTVIHTPSLKIIRRLHEYLFVYAFLTTISVAIHSVCLIILLIDFSLYDWKNSFRLIDSNYIYNMYAKSLIFFCVLFEISETLIQENNSLLLPKIALCMNDGNRQYLGKQNYNSS